MEKITNKAFLLSPLFLVRNKHNTPTIIKYPFWEMTRQNPDAVYACVNLGAAFAPKEIAGRSVCIDGDIEEVLKSISAECVLV